MIMLVMMAIMVMMLLLTAHDTRSAELVFINFFLKLADFGSAKHLETLTMKVE